MIELNKGLFTAKKKDLEALKQTLKRHHARADNIEKMIAAHYGQQDVMNDEGGTTGDKPVPWTNDQNAWVPGKRYTMPNGATVTYKGNGKWGV